MKKFLILLISGICLLGVLSPWANADIQSFAPIPVQSWSGYNNGPIGPVSYNNPNGTTVDSPTNQWHYVIGALADFQNFGAAYDPTSQTLTITTNWSGAAFTTLGAKTADLFLDFGDGFGGPPDGIWDLAIGLRNDRLHNVYSGSLTYYTSQDWNNSYFPKYANAIYGGQYAQQDPKPVPVEAKGDGTPVTNLVTWSNTGGGDPWYAAINLGSLTSYGFDPANGFVFLWGTATCANATVGGLVGPGVVVPLPASVLLLGSGLMGLGLLGFRRRNRVM